MSLKLVIIWDLLITTLFSINISVPPVNLTFLQPQTWMCSYWLSAGWAWGRGCAAERERRKRGGRPQFNDQTKIIFTRLLNDLMHVFAKLTRMMMRIADTPEVAMTLAQFGMRLNKTGTMASAPWSNLFPSTVERWLQEYTQRNTQQICYDHRTQSKSLEKP